MNSLIAKPDSKQDQVESELESSSDSPEASDTSQKADGDSRTNWKKRYSDLKSFHDKKMAEMQKQETFKAPSTPEEVEAFKNKHRDVYNIIRTLAYEEVTSATGDVKQKVESLSEQSSKAAAKAAAKAILKAHPDFNTLKADASFHEWAAEQTQEIQNWIYNNPDNATLAIKAINLFKAETGYKNEASAASDSSAASAVNTNSQPDVVSSKKIWKASEIKRMNPTQYAKYEKEIDKAVEEGRVDYSN